MAQVSLYLNDQALTRLRKDAKKEKRSLSSVVSQLLMERDQIVRWPEGYWDDVYGCLNDESFQAPDEMDAALDGALPSFS